MIDKKRILISLLTGAILGVFCIIGVGARIGYENYIFLVGMWYNRVVMGLLIGLAEDIHITIGAKNILLRVALLGLIVSSAIFISTEFRDIPIFRRDSLWSNNRFYCKQNGKNK
jgi:hypothetical protein